MTRIELIIADRVYPFYLSHQRYQRSYLLNKEQNDEWCDATDDAQRTER
jgi:hypothetical protein